MCWSNDNDKDKCKCNSKIPTVAWLPFQCAKQRVFELKLGTYIILSPPRGRGSSFFNLKTVGKKYFSVVKWTREKAFAFPGSLNQYIFKKITFRACLHGGGIPVLWGWFLLFSRSGGHKTKETYPTRPGSPTPFKQGLSLAAKCLKINVKGNTRRRN